MKTYHKVGNGLGAATQSTIQEWLDDMAENTSDLID